MLPCQHGLNACRDLDSQESLGRGWRVQDAGWLWTCHTVDLGMAAVALLLGRRDMCTSKCRRENVYINMNCTMISCHSNIPGTMTPFPKSLFPTDFPSVSPFGKDGVGNFFSQSE